MTTASLLKNGFLVGKKMGKVTSVTHLIWSFCNPHGGWLYRNRRNGWIHRILTLAAFPAPMEGKVPIWKTPRITVDLSGTAGGIKKMMENSIKWGHFRFF